MKFFYANSMGDNGYFSDKDLIMAIYSAWNIEATLYIVDTKNQSNKLIFEPWESNEFNSELLKEFGYYMADGEKYRDIFDLKTNEIKKYEWSEVKQLI